MGIYKYQGVNREGKRVKGSIDAPNTAVAKKQLYSQGIRVKKIQNPSLLEIDLGQLAIDKGFAKPFGQKELLSFTKQLSTMINAGVPILQTLEILYKAEKHPVLKNAIKGISRDVGEGKTIAQALEVQKGFDRLYVNLVSAGEIGGVLDQILNKLVEHMDKNIRIRAKVKGALTYPTIVVVVGTIIIWGLLVYVVPQFVDMLKDSGQALPGITQFVIDTSNFLGNYSLYLIIGLIAFFIFFKSYIQSPAGKPQWDSIVIRFPIFGSIIIRGNLATFSRTFATMISSGVSLIDALAICVETIDNSFIAKDIAKVRKKVTEGKTLTEPLGKIIYFPEMVVQMVRVGEQTGNLDNMMLRVADVLEDELNDLIENMTKLIEPLIMVTLGSIVAIILVAMYLPMFMSAG